MQNYQKFSQIIRESSRDYCAHKFRNSYFQDSTNKPLKNQICDEFSDGDFDDCSKNTFVKTNKNNESEENLPEYTEYDFNSKEVYNVLLKLKPYQKLRIKDEKLCIDTRPSLFGLTRFFTRDSRWKVLEKIYEIKTITLEEKNIIEDALRVLIDTTYSKDRKWIDDILSRPLEHV